MSDLTSTDTDVFGLACWSAPAHPMPRAHRHDDIEVNVVVSGQLDYLFGGRRVLIDAGVTSIFWAALPHQVVSTADRSSACWLTVPLDIALRWRLAEPKIAALLNGAPLLTSSLEAGPIESQQRFARWSADLTATEPSLTDIALLEMEAFLHRALRVARPVGDARETDRPTTARAQSRAAAMAAFLATRFREPVCVGDVAAAVHLNPHYAMQVFRDAVGTTIGSYLTQCRLAEAQRLLITTPLTVASIAHAAGFGSASRLYAACAEAGLPAPAAYRRVHRDPAAEPADAVERYAGGPRVRAAGTRSRQEHEGH